MTVTRMASNGVEVIHRFIKCLFLLNLFVALCHQVSLQASHQASVPDQRRRITINSNSSTTSRDITSVTSRRTGIISRRKSVTSGIQTGMTSRAGLMAAVGLTTGNGVPSRNNGVPKWNTGVPEGVGSKEGVASRVGVMSERRREEELDDDQTSEEMWLDDFETVFHAQPRQPNKDTMLADSPPVLHPPLDVTTPLPAALESRGVEEEEEADDGGPVCPPPPTEIPTYLCNVTVCDSDKACREGGVKPDVGGASRGQGARNPGSSEERGDREGGGGGRTLCCNNGCRYTCMFPVPPKSYIDWKNEPQRRLASGTSWLIGGPEKQTEVDWCSTSEVYYEDEEPLLCPLGHVCHIDDVGDPTKGIPNRGRCVAVQSNREERRYRIVTNIGSSLNCHVDTAVYSNGTTFQYNNHNCECLEGSVLCKVSRRILP